VRLLVLSLDADGQQQLNRFAHWSKLTIRRRGRETAQSHEADFHCDRGRLILPQ
jgi:hypothetical protein